MADLSGELPRLKKKRTKEKLNSSSGALLEETQSKKDRRRSRKESKRAKEELLDEGELDKPLDAILGAEENEGAAILAGVKTVCREPIALLGVQEESPVAFTPDGSHLAFVAKNGSIFIAKIDAKNDSYTIARTLNGHVLAVKSLLFHPTKPLLFSAGIEGMLFWNYETGELLKKILTEHASNVSHEAEVHCLSVLYDGAVLVSGSKDTNVKAWDLMDETSFSPIETLSGHKASVLCFSYCSDRSLLASAGRDSSIKLWDVSTLDPLMRSKRADDASIKCQLQATLDGHRGDIVSLLFTRAGTRLFSGARDNEIKLWDIDAGVELRSIKGHRGDINDMVLLDDAEMSLLTACSDSYVRVWEMADYGAQDAAPDPALSNVAEDDPDALAEVLATDAAANTPIVGATEGLSAEATAAAVAGGLAIGNVAGDRVIAQHACHSFDTMHMSYHHGKRLLATSSSPNEVRIWDARKPGAPVMLHEFAGHCECITDLVLANANVALSSSRDYNVSVYELANFRRLAKFDFEGSVERLAVTPDRRNVLAGGNHYDIKMYNIDATADESVRFKEVARFVGHAGKVEALAVSPNGEWLASGGHDFDIRLWPIKSKKLNKDGEVSQVKSSAHIDAHRGHVTCLAFNDDGTMLASGGSDHAVLLWKLKKGMLGGMGLAEVWRDSAAHASVVTAVAFGHGPSAHLLFSSSWDATVCVWSVDPRAGSRRNANGDAAVQKKKGVQLHGHTSTCGGPIQQLTLHTAKVSDVTISPDGQYILSASADQSVRCWSATAPYDCIASYVTTDGGFTSVTCADVTFATGSDNAMLRVYPLPGNKKYKKLFEAVQ